jgi:hypothetical protein
MSKQKRKPAPRQTASSTVEKLAAHGRQPGPQATQSPVGKDRPDLYALSQLLRSDRKRTGGWVRLGKLKGAYA